jgi:SAM-dependent methyltransferase
MAFETDHTAVEARLLDRVLTPGAAVLEAGCGRTTRLAERRERIARLVGVDLEEAAGRENAALDEFVAADLHARLPFSDGSFDLVYSNFVVEHLTDPPRVFAEWRRVLRPGGHAVLLTSNVASPLVRLAAALPQATRVAVKRRGPGAEERDVFPTVYRANRPAVLARALAAAGFEPVEMTCVATLHRYAGGRRAPERVLLAIELALPSSRRSTLVAAFRAG